MLLTFWSEQKLFTTCCPAKTGKDKWSSSIDPSVHTARGPTECCSHAWYKSGSLALVRCSFSEGFTHPYGTGKCIRNSKMLELFRYKFAAITAQVQQNKIPYFNNASVKFCTIVQFGTSSAFISENQEGIRGRDGALRHTPWSVSSKVPQNGFDCSCCS